MIAGNRVTQKMSRYMGIDFSGSDTAVSKHLLHGTEVGSILDQFGGETVTETVRAHVFLYPSGLHRILHHLKHTNTRQMVPTTVEKDIVFLSRLGMQVTAYFVYVTLH